jgi:hypothetical protein
MTNPWDEFSKSLAQPLPRRESLRRLGIALAGAVLSPLGLQSAAAGHHPKPQPDLCKSFCKCRNKKQQDQCLKACSACGKDRGRLSGSCGSYFCCSAGLSSCGSYCTDLASDPSNCGACAYVCDQPGPYEYGACINGRCVYSCVEGAVNCNGSCTFLASDPYNCGACGSACELPGPNEYAVCIDGQCEYGCFEGAVDCDGACTFLGWDPANCGACGNVCGGSTPYCNNGVCIRGDEPCPAGTRCSGVCTNIAFDTANCGVCGHLCQPGETCSGGICQSPF